MMSTAQTLWATLSIPALTLLAALAWLPKERAERMVRLALLTGALVVAIGSMWSTTGQAVLSNEFPWLSTPGTGPTINMGIRVDTIFSGLTLAIALLSCVTLASLPRGWRRTDTVLLLTASAASHVAIIGDHLLLRLAAVEGLLLSVLLLIVNRRCVAGLLATQRLAAGALLLAGLIVGWQDASMHLPRIEPVERWVPLLTLLAILALGGALPFHRSLRSLATQPAAVRAHVSALLLLVAAGFSVSLAGQLDPQLAPAVTICLIVVAAAAAILSLAALDAGRAQLWMWSSQLGFALVVTLHAGAGIAVSVWICLALVRPAAAHALDIVQSALGDESPNTRRWGGLAKALPMAFGLSTLAAAAVALPPLGLFAALVHLLAPFQLGDPASAPVFAVALFIALPAMRLGLGPFVGTSRSSVLAPHGQTSLSRSVAAMAVVSAVVGLLWPLSELIADPLPPLPTMGVGAILGLGLPLTALLLGRHRGKGPESETVSPWRAAVDDGLPLPSHIHRWPQSALRQLAWCIDLLALLPAFVTGLLRASVWLLAWIDSRPLMWAGAGIVGLIAALLLERAQ